MNAIKVPARLQSDRRGPIDPRLLHRVGPVRRLLILHAVLGTLRAAAIVTIAGGIAYAVGGVFAQHTVDPAIAALPWLVAGFLARSLLAWLSEVVSARAAIATKSQLRREVAGAYLRPDQDQPDRGTVITLITTGLDELDGYFAKYLPQLVLAVVVPAVIIVAVTVRDLLSAVIIVCTLPLIPIFMILVGWTTQELTGKRWRVQARLSHHFVDLVAGLPTLRVFHRAKAQAEGLRRSGEAHRVETMATLRIALLSALILEGLATLSVAIVAVVMGLRVISGGVDLTTGLFILVLAPEAYLPLRQVGTHYHDGANGVAAAQTALDLVESPDPAAAPTDDSDATRPTGSATGIELDRVTYRYPRSAQPVLADLSLTAAPGELTVLTGPSGGGKSTVLAMIMGWLQPEAGRIRVCGEPPQQAASTIAWVGQEPALLRGTVADNVGIGWAAADRDQIVEALQAADLDLDPDRTVDETSALSAGELRRVALARAWLRIRYGGGQVMIMDEPTAGLDAATELATIETVRRLGVTALCVSHRRAVLAAADRVITVEPR